MREALLGLGDWLLVMSTGHQSANFASNSEDTTMIFEIDIPAELVPGVIATPMPKRKRQRTLWLSMRWQWPPKPART
jgi:hypothetical protein